MLRARILNAAIKEFSKNGYHGTSTKAIARRARVSEMSVFRHFGTKEKLCRAALEAVMERQPALPTEGSPLEKVERLALDLARHFLAQPADILFIDAVGLSGLRTLSSVVVRRNRALWACLLTWLREAQGRGELRNNLDLDALVYSLLANVLAIKELGLKFPTVSECMALFQKVVTQMLAQYRA